MSTVAGPESRFFDVNGLRLHHLDWGNTSAPTIVCVHGLRGNAHSFDGFARHFRDRFHVVAVDVRGRGDSAWAPDGDYTMPSYVADLEMVLDELAFDRLTLVGTSMGGRIAMLYAGRHPERLDRLIINDIGPDAEAGSDRISREAAHTPDSFPSLEAAMVYRREISASLERLSEGAQRESALTQVRQLPDGSWVWKSDLAFLRQRADSGSVDYTALWDVVARLQCPTLLVWGSASDVLSEGQARRMVRTLAHGTLVQVTGVGHAPTLTEPEAVAGLETFLSLRIKATS